MKLIFKHQPWINGVRQKSRFYYDGGVFILDGHEIIPEHPNLFVQGKEALHSTQYVYEKDPLAPKEPDHQIKKHELVTAVTDLVKVVEKLQHDVDYLMGMVEGKADFEQRLKQKKPDTTRCIGGNPHFYSDSDSSLFHG